MSKSDPEPANALYCAANLRLCFPAYANTRQYAECKACIIFEILPFEHYQFLLSNW